MFDIILFSDHVNLEMELSKALDKMGDMAITRDDEEDDIGAAFQKFAVVTKELSALMRNLVRFNLLIFSASQINLTNVWSSCQMQYLMLFSSN
jgi:hypothetical protein